MWKKTGLYHPNYEHDNCGIGFVVNIEGHGEHSIITDGIGILKKLTHRGAVGGDMKTGDGAGMMTRVPHDFFVKTLKEKKIKLPDLGLYGVGMVFLPKDEKKRNKAVSIIESTVKRENCEIITWRQVPVQKKSLGETSEASMPFISQVFIKPKNTKQLEHQLYFIRKKIEREAMEDHLSIEDFYFCSLSSQTIIYKGLFIPEHFIDFYPDLADKDFKSPFALIHQRYSTNTSPSWPLAQPFRRMAHNGEINTLRGNANKMKAWENNNLVSETYKERISEIFPLIMPGLSDSGAFDNIFELLEMNGRHMAHSMMMMMPEAYGVKYHISQDKRAFYEYHAALMDPWDGPAAISFCNGKIIGAALDRNGLRPARYIITHSGKLVLASEVGVLDFPAEDVLQKGRLAPGKMIMVDMDKKRVIYDNEIKAGVSRRRRYRRWLEQNKIELKGLFQYPGSVEVNQRSLLSRQKLFSYTLEDIRKTIIPMAKNAQEPVGSMGNDTPLAVLSKKPQLLYNYFKQLFAQVTNPPIDPYRENLVMSLMSFIGRERNFLTESPKHCKQLKLSHPILTLDDITKLKNSNIDSLECATVSITYSQSISLEEALDAICAEAEKAIDNGASIIILSDMDSGEEKTPVPALLATCAAHHYLTTKQKRNQAGIIIESGEIREVTHFAALIGFGASAIYPYLAYETIADEFEKGSFSKELTLETAIENYITAVKKGLLKIMSKMGISTLRSYRFSQLFEAVGLNSEFVNKYFPGTPTRIGGVGLKEIERELKERHKAAFKEEYSENLYSGGNIHYRYDSEKHLFSPSAIVYLQKAVRTGNYELFKKYSKEINNRAENLCTLRGLFKFRNKNPIPIEEVEPVESIVKRFVSSAMSFGSISREAHETMAIAMNKLGGASNSGEGGEDENRYRVRENGDNPISAVKQVASGRFGVNINYLTHCNEIQIKMAQGAKPGEGGQLPGHKVNDEIAKVRHSIPGVMLISPPPHHDIYSIEDLAQLIFDLKNANREARVSVKLVSVVGIGTIAAGVAKGKADMILISGHDGGTGASPISSIKHTGVPWEIGLAETQQTLLLNQLRSRVRIQTDGQIKTGRDVAIACLLGAEEFGFGTAALVSLGCVMMRKCHKNTCPVGVATQNPELRKRFAGKPEHLMNFARFIAREVREIMAELGFRTIQEMVGQADRLETDRALNFWKTKGLDFSKVLYKAKLPPTETYYQSKPQEHDWTNSIDLDLVKKCRESIKNQTPVELDYPITNKNRTVGTILSSTIAREYGAEGLPDNTIQCRFKGSAGQSFGAFLSKGVSFNLEGDANDYVGKGLSGGRIVIYPAKGSKFRPEYNIISGNVNLFGAINGELYINGMAGERFAVRNSGATAVVEGVGDHGCEYMTGGTVAVLGKTGVNFAAGMSGGIAYVFDEDQLFDTKCNLDMVNIEPLLEKEDKDALKKLIAKHHSYTGSRLAERILESWREALPMFVKVIPIDYQRALERIKELEFKETELVSITEEVY